MKPAQVYIDILITEDSKGCFASNSNRYCSYIEIKNPGDYYCNMFKEQLNKESFINNVFIIKRCNKCISSQIK